MRANGKKTGEGAASAVCTRNNFQIFRYCPDKTNNIRELNERLGAICGLDLLCAHKVVNMSHVGALLPIGRDYADPPQMTEPSVVTTPTSALAS